MNKKILIIACLVMMTTIFSGCDLLGGDKHQEKIKKSEDKIDFTIESNKINKVNIDAQTKAQEEAIASLTNNSTANNNEDNSGCDWIDESDITMRLDLLEEYKAKSSYTVGFAHLDNYGSIYRTGRSAREVCDYRVGFNKDDFVNHKGIHIPYAEAGLSFYFTYEGQPLQMILKEGLPDYNGELVLKVTGRVSAADDLFRDVLKGQ